MNEQMIHEKPKIASVPNYYKLLAALNHMSSALVRREGNKVVRAGVTKNHSKGTSKARRRMAKESRRRNRK